MSFWLTTWHENRRPSLSPLGERVDRAGAFISRRGTGEGVFQTTPPRIFMAAKDRLVLA